MRWNGVGAPFLKKILEARMKGLEGKLDKIFSSAFKSS
jgi:hypothetical protein